MLQVEELRKARRKRNVGRRNREKKEQHVASSEKKVAKGMQEKQNREERNKNL
ncbi:hypothetical protein P9W99_20780 [Bacillus cereus]|uniref:hypothetical protein n=1 Tax=Bacillus cereus group TaxID=86661 RepID=UPI0003A81A7E|nr:MULTISPECIES: hypothetical protein [Bacillus cereus group]KEH49366.1 hypothetical protein BG09_1854 [Bacillus thuringiensis serovar kurstaki str. HD-1]MBU0452268.1 hypothetical protein [Bacillus thuringiensis]MCC3918757.1 hypothetical protein [Bacillus thuringiensis]MCC3933072.1 hypothetical protein [Bacillus thuringiensis]MCC3970667.1 hypothetical protein [Bacillus thuringiensis]